MLSYCGQHMTTYCTHQYVGIYIEFCHILRHKRNNRGVLKLDQQKEWMVVAKIIRWIYQKKKTKNLPTNNKQLFEQNELGIAGATANLLKQRRPLVKADQAVMYLRVRSKRPVLQARASIFSYSHVVFDPSRQRVATLGPGLLPATALIPSSVLRQTMDATSLCRYQQSSVLGYDDLKFISIWVKDIGNFTFVIFCC